MVLIFKLTINFSKEKKSECRLSKSHIKKLIQEFKNLDSSDCLPFTAKILSWAPWRLRGLLLRRRLRPHAPGEHGIRIPMWVHDPLLHWFRHFLWMSRLGCCDDVHLHWDPSSKIACKRHRTEADRPDGLWKCRIFRRWHRESAGWWKDWISWINWTTPWPRRNSNSRPYATCYNWGTTIFYRSCALNGKSRIQSGFFTINRPSRSDCQRRQTTTCCCKSGAKSSPKCWRRRWRGEQKKIWDKHFSDSPITTCIISGGSSVPNFWRNVRNVHFFATHFYDF